MIFTAVPVVNMKFVWFRFQSNWYYCDPRFEDCFKFRELATTIREIETICRAIPSLKKMCASDFVMTCFFPNTKTLNSQKRSVERALQQADAPWHCQDLLMLRTFGRLGLGCIEADFRQESTDFQYNIFRRLHDLYTSAPLHLRNSATFCHAFQFRKFSSILQMFLSRSLFCVPILMTTCRETFTKFFNNFVLS